MVYRIALDDIEVQGRIIPQGASLFLSTPGAANHDPMVFSSPEVLNIRRREGRSLSFGGGLHHCLGYRLALAEMEVALEVLLTRLPKMRPVTAGIQRNRRANLRGVSVLPVTPGKYKRTEIEGPIHSENCDIYPTKKKTQRMATYWLHTPYKTE